MSTYRSPRSFLRVLAPALVLSWSFTLAPSAVAGVVLVDIQRTVEIDGNALQDDVGFFEDTLPPRYQQSTVNGQFSGNLDGFQLAGDSRPATARELARQNSNLSASLITMSGTASVSASSESVGGSGNGHALSSLLVTFQVTQEQVWQLDAKSTITEQSDSPLDAGTDAFVTLMKGNEQIANLNGTSLHTFIDLTPGSLYVLRAGAEASAAAGGGLLQNSAESTIDLSLQDAPEPAAFALVLFALILCEALRRRASNRNRLLGFEYHNAIPVQMPGRSGVNPPKIQR